MCISEWVEASPNRCCNVPSMHAMVEMVSKELVFDSCQVHEVPEPFGRYSVAP